MIINKIKIILVSIIFYGKINTKIILERSDTYGNYNSPSKIAFINVTTENGKQYINYHAILAEELGDKIGIIFSLEYSANKKTYVKIRTIKEKNACRALNAYGGEPWIEMQRAAGILPKVCPIKPGTYKIEHKEIDLDKMAFQAIPMGKIRINYTLIHNSDTGSFSELVYGINSCMNTRRKVKMWQLGLVVISNTYKIL